MTEPRRLRRFLITKRFLTNMFKQGGVRRFEITRDGLPEDAVIEWLGHCWETDCVYAVVRSEEFDPVEEGYVIPYHPAPFISLVEEDELA